MRCLQAQATWRRHCNATTRDRQPYGAWLVERGRHIGATIAARDAEPSLRIDTVMREYGAAGLVARPADRRAGRRMSPRPK